jgi:GPH family glycoside/pentoside/hexuronide:cation symporter
MSSTAVSAQRLNFGYLTLFGLGGLAGYYSTAAVQMLATPVYQMTLGVNPAWLGLMLTIPRILDAVVDPIVGNISDNTHSRFGRRRPFIIFGAVAMAFAFGLIWMVPTGWNQTSQLAWFGLTSVLFFFCHSIFSVPLQSLGYEITPDYDERTRVMGFTSFWNRIGELTYSWIFPLSQLALFATPMMGVRWVAWGVAFLFLAIPGLIAGYVGRERFARMTEHQGKVLFWPTVRAAASSRPFRYLAAIVVTTLLVGMLASSMDYYLLVYYVCHGDLAQGSLWKGVLSSAYGIVGLLSVPVLTFVSKRIGKESTMIAILCLLVVGACARWWIFRPGAGWLLVLDPILGGGAIWVAITMIVQSMLADICDEDELTSGQRREGLFGAVFSWLQKTGVSLSFLSTGTVLNLIGFDAARKADQTPNAILGMRIFLSAAPALAAIVCIGLLLRYPISRARAQETRRLLEIRRGAV